MCVYSPTSQMGTLEKIGIVTGSAAGGAAISVAVYFAVKNIWMASHAAIGL